MEDYDQFVQRRLSQLRKSEGEHKPPAASLIRFHGRCILPPLLSGEQREEMQRHREAAQESAAHRKIRDHERMACVQTILHSVQLRTSPTLEELLQELKINPKSSHSFDSCEEVSPTNLCSGMADWPSMMMNGDNVVSHPPMSSTTNSAFITSIVTPQQSYQDGGLIHQHDNQKASQAALFNAVSRSTVSSGYVTHENTENTTSVSETIDTVRNSHGFGSVEEGFFLQNASNTIAKMPDIISHPPVDGEELEESGQRPSFYNDFIAGKDISHTQLQTDSVICGDARGEKAPNSHLDCAVYQDNLPFTQVPNLDEDRSLDRMEVAVHSLENGDSPELSQTLSAQHCPIAQLHIQHNPEQREPADNCAHEEDSKPSEEPYRLSLQALLKKSQEYRRRQRMLRNQAKNTKIQEKAQERPSVEEQSLSDKENDEFPNQGTVAAEGRNVTGRRGTFSLSVETSAKKSWENEQMIQDGLIWKKTKDHKSERAHLAGDGNTEEMSNAEAQTALRNNKMNISPDIITEPKQITISFQQQPSSTETSPVRGAFYLTSEQNTTCATTFLNGGGKYHTIPAPNVCGSPVHYRGKGRGKDRQVVNRAGTSKGKVLLDKNLSEDSKVDAQGNSGHQKCQSSAVQQIVKGDVASVLAKSSQNIDQLESNLSSLKELISDLESTLTENFDNNDCAERSGGSVNLTQPLENSQHMGQNHGDKREEEPRDQDGGWAAGDRQWLRQSFDICEKMHKGPGHELDGHDAPDPLLIPQEKGRETVSLTEARLTKNAEKNEDKNEGLIKSLQQHAGCRKLQPKAQSILHLVQQRRVPDVFRNVPVDVAAPHGVPALLDASHHPTERSGVADLPYLNESYDVEKPSGLWLLETSDSDPGSRGHLILGSHLTPESADGSGGGGASKVKRRLLMPTTEDTLNRTADSSVRSMVRPNSSTPKGGRGGQRDVQELRLAHAAQIQALQEEHRRQQEELLQALAARYRLLQSVSFPRSVSASHPGDTLTFSMDIQASDSLLDRYRPLLLAAAKGFLTRRLLRTERVALLVRTIGDTQQFLRAFQQQNPSREVCSRQDLLLLERVTLQLRASRYEVYDIFFSLSVGERMQLISWDRELVRERERRRQSSHASNPKGKSSLSAATQKSLERKRGKMIQRKAVEWHRGVRTGGHKAGISAEQPTESKRGQFKGIPQRVPKSTHSSRPR